MRYAIIENGVVINVAKSSEALDTNWIQSDTATKGDTYAAGEFASPAVITTATDIISECEQYINSLIQGEVDNYNSENNTSFSGIHSCANYALAAEYTHQAFCAAVWAWNIEVWEAARLLLEQAVAGDITISSSSDISDDIPEFSWTSTEV